MFELFKVGRLNKITSSHSEKLSNRIILMNCVNAIIAKRNLTKDQYDCFLKIYTEVNKEKKSI